MSTSSSPPTPDDLIIVLDQPCTRLDRISETVMTVESTTTKKQFFITTRTVAPGETLFVEDCVGCVTFFRRGVLDEGNVKLLYPVPLLTDDKVMASPPDPSLGADSAWALVWQILQRFCEDAEEAIKVAGEAAAVAAASPSDETKAAVAKASTAADEAKASAIGLTDHLLEQLPKGGAMSLGNALKRPEALTVDPFGAKPTHQGHRNWIAFVVRRFSMMPLKKITELYAAVNCHLHQLRLPLSDSIHGAALYVRFSQVGHSCVPTATAYDELMGKIRLVASCELAAHTPLSVNKMAICPYARSVMVGPDSLRQQAVLVTGGLCFCDECRHGTDKFGFNDDRKAALRTLDDYWNDSVADSAFRDVLENIDNDEARALLGMLERFKHVFLLSRMDAFPNAPLVAGCIDANWHRVDFRRTLLACRKLGYFLGRAYAFDVLARPTAIHPAKDFVVRNLLGQQQLGMIEQSLRRCGASKTEIGRKLAPMFIHVALTDFCSHVVPQIFTAVRDAAVSSEVTVDSTLVTRLLEKVPQERVKRWREAFDRFSALNIVRLADRLELMSPSAVKIDLDTILTREVSAQAERSLMVELAGNTALSLCKETLGAIEAVLGQTNGVEENVEENDDID